jgi:hypothetical protein
MCILNESFIDCHSSKSEERNETERNAYAYCFTS